MDRRFTSSKQALREGQWNWVKNGREQNWVLLQGDDLSYFRSTFFRPWFYRTTSFDSTYTVSKSVYILILGIKTCETHEWPKTINTKKPLRIQHNRAKKNNSYKQRKTSQVFTPRMTRILRQFDESQIRSRTGGLPHHHVILQTWMKS